LAEILRAVEGINLEYMYSFTLKRGGTDVLVFRFDDPDRAITALTGKGINVLSSVELSKRLA
jgi:hypothetical protein